MTTTRSRLNTPNHEPQSDDGVADAIEDLQMRLTYQEDDIKALNLIITRQQDEIDQLRTELTRLKDLVRSTAAGAVGPKEDEPPPPHY